MSKIACYTFFLPKPKLRVSLPVRWSYRDLPVCPERYDLSARNCFYDWSTPVDALSHLDHCLTHEVGEMSNSITALS